jgi:zinc/manganese transport system substrate-binding protein
MALVVRRAVLLGAIALAMVATSCASPSNDTTATSSTPGTAPTGSTPARPPVVVASTQLVGALVRSVAGDAVELRVLIDPGADPTTATIEDDAVLDDADLIVVVDPSTYELGLADRLEADGRLRPDVLALAPQLNPIPLGGRELEAGSTDDGGATDPHVWLDPDRWTQAARLVGDRLDSLDGVDPSAITANVAAFDESVSRTDETVQATFAIVPADRRALVSDLPALGYLADRYGFDLRLAGDPATLSATAASNGARAVFTAPSPASSLTPTFAGADPPVLVVGLDLDATAVDATALDLGGATAAYVELLVSTADSIASGVST